MIVRVVSANQNEVRFYDIEKPSAPLKLVGRLEDPTARLHDRDLKSDRPGIVFDRAPPSSGRRGGVGHHGTGGERRPRKHAAQIFAEHAAEELERARRADQFSRLVIMAGPPFLGLLRAALSEPLERLVVAEIPKDLLGQPDSSVRDHLPVEVFRELP
jgi:protein required for attachment to host cells